MNDLWPGNTPCMIDCRNHYCQDWSEEVAEDKPTCIERIIYRNRTPLMATNKFFFPYGSFSIKDGFEINFLEDTWLGTTPLQEQYPTLYDIVQGSRKSDTLAQVLVDNHPNVTFRRNLVGPRLASWHELLLRLANVNLTQGTDEFRWNLRTCGKFSVDSMYTSPVQPDVPVDNNKKI